MPFDVSLIIVSYKVRDVLRDCLRTLYHQNGLRNVAGEVLVVDNASGDGTAEMVRTEFPEARVLALSENLGFAGANNVGLREATGRNLLLLNPDTLIPDGAIRDSVQYLDSQPVDVGAMGCRVAGPNGVTQWECARRAVTPADEISRAFMMDRFFPRSDRWNREQMPGWDRSDERDVESLLGAFILVRRTAYEKIGGLDERFFLMYEDTDYCTRLRAAGYRIRYYPGVTITHLGGQSWKQEKIATFANSHVAALQYMEKHFPADVARVRRAHQVGMEMKIAMLRVLRLLKPNSEWAQTHLPMALAARESLRTGAIRRTPPSDAIK